VANNESQQDNSARQPAGRSTDEGESPLASVTGLEETAAAEIERLRADLQEAGDRMLRAQAELENYRKRARRELDDERRYALMPLLRDLLPVVDNIQRAIAAADKSPDAASLLDGIKMVAQNLESALARHQCVRIDALNKSFDPAYHEAISQQPSAQHPPHTVIFVAQDGFTLHDRVVRPAQVVVSTAPAAGEAK
jgi:molecular chaperone GrpE